MKYQLIHRDGAGKCIESQDYISYLAFIKHLTFAGINSSFFPCLPFRYSAYFLEFLQYKDWASGFKRLPHLINDPTETAYLSNRIGRAFADYFAKKIYGARFTHCYESAMYQYGMDISGSRPDFYCDTLKSQFAIEAKGYSAHSISDQLIDTKHKIQASSGKIPVNFSVASISYNLYKSPKIKFYDPIVNDINYDERNNLTLRNQYLSGFIEFIDPILKIKSKSSFNDYYTYELSYTQYLRTRIIIHRAILDKNWEKNDWLFSISQEEDKNLYIDLDGIGLMLDQ